MNDTNLESKEQLTQELQSNPTSQPLSEFVIPLESIKQLRTVRTLGIICLILGAISLIGWVTCAALTFFVNLYYHWFFLFLAWPCTIVCFVCLVLLIVCIIIKTKNRLPAKYALAKPILGTVFAFSFWAFLLVWILIVSIR